MGTHLLMVLQTAPRSVAEARAAAQNWMSAETARMSAVSHVHGLNNETVLPVQWPQFVSKRLFHVGVSCRPSAIGSQAQQRAHALFPDQTDQVLPGRVVGILGCKAIVLGLTLEVSYPPVYSLSQKADITGHTRKAVEQWCARYPNENMDTDCAGYLLWLPEKGLLVGVLRSPWGEYYPRTDRTSTFALTEVEVLPSSVFDRIVDSVCVAANSVLGTTTPAWLPTKHHRDGAWWKYSAYARSGEDEKVPRLPRQKRNGIVWLPWAAGSSAWRFRFGFPREERFPSPIVSTPAVWTGTLLDLACAFVQAELLGAGKKQTIQEAIDGVADHGHRLEEDPDVRLGDVVDSAGPACAEARARIFSAQRYWQELAGYASGHFRPVGQVDEYARLEDRRAQFGIRFGRIAF